jgi:hypothetical protein
MENQIERICEEELQDLGRPEDDGYSKAEVLSVLDDIEASISTLHDTAMFIKEHYLKKEEVKS